MEATLELCRGLNIQENMRIKILGDKDTPAYIAATEVIGELGHKVVSGVEGADIAIAPLLTYKLTDEEANTPLHGTLIFHPSPLPHGRGASAIRWAYRRHEHITAATWIWAAQKMDAGDICEMEIIKIDYSLSPRGLYIEHMIPALKRTLKRCLVAVQRGYIRKVPQVEDYATFDNKL